jgi:predicted transcriptional regulator
MVFLLGHHTHERKTSYLLFPYEGDRVDAGVEVELAEQVTTNTAIIYFSNIYKIAMREGAIRTLDDDDLEFVYLLRSLGVQRNVAKVIIYLAAVGEAKSREIEHGCDLRQPEISIAMRELRRKNWISEREVKTEGKGRPSKVYVLTTPVDEIIKSIEDEKLKVTDEAMESIQKLRDLAAVGSKVSE